MKQDYKQLEIYRNPTKDGYVAFRQSHVRNVTEYKEFADADWPSKADAFTAARLYVNEKVKPVMYLNRTKRVRQRTTWYSYVVNLQSARTKDFPINQHGNERAYQLARNLLLERYPGAAVPEVAPTSPDELDRVIEELRKPVTDLLGGRLDLVPADVSSGGPDILGELAYWVATLVYEGSCETKLFGVSTGYQESYKAARQFLVSRVPAIRLDSKAPPPPEWHVAQSAPRAVQQWDMLVQVADDLIDNDEENRGYTDVVDEECGAFDESDDEVVVTPTEDLGLAVAKRYPGEILRVHQQALIFGWISKVCLDSGNVRRVFFPDIQYGGSSKALSAAVRYLEMFKTRSVELPRTGLCLSRVVSRQGKVRWVWQANYKEATGKPNNRTFNVNRYGYAGAYALARAVRCAYAGVDAIPIDPPPPPSELCGGTSVRLDSSLHGHDRMQNARCCAVQEALEGAMLLRDRIGRATVRWIKPTFSSLERMGLFYKDGNWTVNVLGEQRTVKLHDYKDRINAYEEEYLAARNMYMQILPGVPMPLNPPDLDGPTLALDKEEVAPLLLVVDVEVTPNLREQLDDGTDPIRLNAEDVRSLHDALVRHSTKAESELAQTDSLLSKLKSFR